MHHYQVVIRDQETVLADYVCTTTSISTFVIGVFNKAVVKSFHENIHAWLLRLISETKSFLFINHHVITSHEVIHGVFQLWNLKIIVMATGWDREIVKVYQVIAYYVELVGVGGHVHEALVLQCVVLDPCKVV